MNPAYFRKEMGRFILLWKILSFISALKKMVVNHIDKTFVTSDAATILKEL